ncbi:hypothetical protein [Alkalibacter mobilis]|nr:hypothetical protein [Alkalibacter mobilis]
MEDKTVLEVIKEIEENELKDLPPEQREAYIHAMKFFMLAI